MNFKVDNLIIDFEYCQIDESIGEQYLEIPNQVIRDFLAYHYDLDFSKKIDFYDIDFEGFVHSDYFEYFFDSIEDELFTITDTDLAIILINYIFNECEEDVIIKCGSTNPYWILHDICHAKNDVNNLDIYIDRYVEEDRIIEGIELAMSLNMELCVTLESLNIWNEDFKNRWGEGFDIEQAINLINGKYKS